MIVDEDRKYTLTKYATVRGQKEIKKSDHNLLMLVLEISWSSLHQQQNQRKEIFNFRNSDDFDKYKIETEDNQELLKCFEDVTDLNTASNKWLKTLNNIIRKCFRKVRLGKTLKNEN
jgi:hypothetical protein